MDIFSKIANGFTTQQNDDFDRIANAFLSQPLKMRHDYGSKESADFLADSTVQRNTGHDQGLFNTGVGNALPMIDMDFPDDMLLSQKMPFVEVEYEIIDDLDSFEDYRMARLPSHKHNPPEVVEEAYMNFLEEHGLKEKFEAQQEKMRNQEKLAGGHERGSYMSIQNLNEMKDMVELISDMVHHGEELEDWVEDKLSHAHGTIQDLARYFGYGEGSHHDHHKFSSLTDMMEEQQDLDLGRFDDDVEGVEISDDDMSQEEFDLAYGDSDPFSEEVEGDFYMEDEIFDDFDLDGDGEISRDEWDQGFEGLDSDGDGMLSKDEVYPFYYDGLDSLDTDGDGEISRDEWDQGFDDLDLNEDGMLSRDEFDRLASEFRK